MAADVIADNDTDNEADCHPMLCVLANEEHIVFNNVKEEPAKVTHAVALLNIRQCKLFKTFSDRFHQDGSDSELLCVTGQVVLEKVHLEPLVDSLVDSLEPKTPCTLNQRLDSLW